MSDKKTEKMDEEHEGVKQALLAFSVLGGVGVFIAVVVIVFLYAGMFLDDALEMNGAGRILGIFTGFPVALYCIYRRLKRGKFFGA